MNVEEYNGIKVGDTVTARKYEFYDYRDREYIPTFIIKEIDVQEDTVWLRHTKNKICGIKAEFCTLVKGIPTIIEDSKNHEKDKILINDFMKFYKDSDYVKVEDAIDDFIEQYYEE